MMLLQRSSLQNFISRLDKQHDQSKPLDSLLLESVVESFIDGILILTDRGDWIQANELARKICNQLTQGKSQSNLVPDEIWSVCQLLIESRGLYPNQPVIIEQEITKERGTELRIRVQWLNLSEISRLYLLVILEDRGQFVQNLLLTEFAEYGLTPREMEVWLLHRSHFTYKEIAAKLFISLNTVKKHMKNIHAKREVVSQ